MTDREIIELLERTGHLHYPFGKRQLVPEWEGTGVPPGRSLYHPVAVEAIRSFQDFTIEHLDPLCLHHHSRPARCDGVIGPATIQLMERPRCGCCDYGESVRRAVGKGSWKSCHGIGDFHAATVKVHKQGMPSFLEPLFEQIWDGIRTAFEAMGLQFIRTEHDNANIDFRFETRRTDWIGLAQVAYGLSCTSKLWCKYSARYRPANLVREWTTLGLHEFFHNCSGQHTRTGIMSPYIVNGLPPTWIGDSSEPIIRRLFGGEPIEPIPPRPDPPSPPDDEGGIVEWSDGRWFDAVPQPLGGEGNHLEMDGRWFALTPRARKRT